MLPTATFRCSPSQAGFVLTLRGNSSTFGRHALWGARPVARPVVKVQSHRIIEVTLRRPLGMVLAENESDKSVFVEELTQGGNAEESGKVAVGDILSKISATTLKAGRDGSMKEGYGQRPYDNWEKVMFNCEGQDFRTVMAALDSNNPRWGINKVTLVLKRKE